MNARHEVEARAAWRGNFCGAIGEPCPSPNRCEFSGCQAVAYPRRPSGPRASDPDDEDAYAELRAARVRAAMALPPGLAGPLEFAVPEWQLDGLRYHVMVRGCV